MKQRIFTLVMMFALVIMASSSMAQTLNQTSVYPGGNYLYKVNGVSASTNATVSVDYIPDAAGTGATVDNVTPTAIVGAASAVSVTFDVTYGTVASPSADGVVRVTATQGTCTNYIDLRIDVTDPPTWTLTLTSDAALDAYGCQQALTSPLDDGTADAYAGGDNTITFSVASGAAPAGTPTFIYDIAASSVAFVETCTSCGTGKTADADFAVTFPSLEGAGGNVVGTISNAKFTMDADHGGGEYDMTVVGSAKTVTVSPLPTIGAFGL